MKPLEKKPEEVYRIINRETGEAAGSYSRSYHEKFDFESPEEAMGSNVFGIFKDKQKYAIAKYKVTYELIDPDCDTETKDPRRESGAS